MFARMTSISPTGRSGADARPEAAAEALRLEGLAHREALWAAHCAEFERLTPMVRSAMGILGDAKFGRVMGVMRRYRVVGSMPDRPAHNPGVQPFCWVLVARRDGPGERAGREGAGAEVMDVSKHDRVELIPPEEDEGGEGPYRLVVRGAGADARSIPTEASRTALEAAMIEFRAAGS
jgi:hypothetical protein